jgi:7-carboxy-7-deazaguanine synthase
MSISPKLANSTPTAATAGVDWVDRHERTRLDREPLGRLVAGYRHQLKFVVDPDAGLDKQMTEIRLIVRDANASNDAVMLMAEGTDADSLHRKEQALVDVCVEHGYRLCPRFHVDLFGNTRGT